MIHKKYSTNTDNKWHLLAYTWMLSFGILQVTVVEFLSSYLRMWCHILSQNQAKEISNGEDDKGISMITSKLVRLLLPCWEMSEHKHTAESWKFTETVHKHILFWSNLLGTYMFVVVSLEPVTRDCSHQTWDVFVFWLWIHAIWQSWFKCPAPLSSEWQNAGCWLKTLQINLRPRD